MLSARRRRHRGRLVGNLPDRKPGKIAGRGICRQAVFDWNPDLRIPDPPGNLFSEPKAITLDPAKSGTIKLTLTKQTPPDKPPADTTGVKYVKFPSKLLSQFHGRPMFLRAGIILPRNYGQDANQKYPLLVVIGGYGTRYTAAANWGQRRGRGLELPMVTLFLDGAGPFGDPYQVNSANNGPLGDAITQELIPFVEQQYHCIGQPFAVHDRDLDRRLGVAGIAGFLSGFLQWLLVVRSGPGRFSGV